MKNFGKIVLTILVLFMVFFSSQAKADIIPENSHFVERCIKIDGIKDTLDYYVVTANTLMNLSHIVKDNECLENAWLGAAPKWYVDEKGLQNIDFYHNQDSNVIKSNIDLIHGKYLDKSNPLSREEDTYKILGFKDRTFWLYLSQHISEYNDGGPKRIEDYTISGSAMREMVQNISEVPNPTPTTTPAPSTPIPVPTTPTPTITENPIIPFLNNTGSSVMVLIIAGVLVIICVGLYFVMKKKK